MTATKQVMRIGLVVLAGALFGALLLIHPTIHSAFTPDTAHAVGDTYALSGYAWAGGGGGSGGTDEGVGLMQLNGVTVGADGTTLKGYAWMGESSDGVAPPIGWVSFNTSDLAGCPSGTCSATVVNGALLGWARACAGTVNADCTGASRTDGWDGWISLNTKAGDSSTYGPAIPGGAHSGTFSGYVWGGGGDSSSANWGMGWIDFTGVTLSPIGTPVITISFSGPTRVRSGSTATLTYTVNNPPASCTVTGKTATTTSYSANISPLDGVQANVAPAPVVYANTLFTLTCSTVSKSVTVGIDPTIIEQ